MWIDAEHFGAKCVKVLSQEVTHIVSHPRCDASSCKRENTFLVTFDWLEMSIWKWSREPEKRYLML